VIQLRQEIQEALSVNFRPDTVGKPYYKAGAKLLERSQDDVLSLVGDGDRLVTIAPGSGLEAKNHLAILTQRDVIKFERRLFNRAWTDRMPLTEVAEVELKIHMSGAFIIHIISEKALPYKQIRMQSSPAAIEKYWKNTMQFEMQDSDLARHFVALLEGGADRAKAGLWDMS
jgi:hypothetical protein